LLDVLPGDVVHDLAHRADAHAVSGSNKAHSFSVCRSSAYLSNSTSAEFRSTIAFSTDGVDALSLGNWTSEVPVGATLDAREDGSGADIELGGELTGGSAGSISSPDIGHDGVWNLRVLAAAAWWSSCSWHRWPVPRHLGYITVAALWERLRYFHHSEKLGQDQLSSEKADLGNGDGGFRHRRTRLRPVLAGRAFTLPRRSPL
jgi:hypothetical protein